MLRRCLVLCLAMLGLQAAPPAFTKSGKGPGILLIHGFGGNKEVWAATAAELSRDHTVVCVDLPGSGGTPGPVIVDGRAEYGPLAKDLVQLVRKEGLAPCLIVGHSMGGPIGGRTVLEDPSAFRGFLLADGFLGPLPPAMMDPFVLEIGKDPKAALSAWFKEDATSTTQLDRIVGEALRVPKETLQAYIRNTTRDPLNGRLRDLKLPVLMVAAGPLETDPAKAADYMSLMGLRGVPTFRMVNLPKAKHWVMWDEPEAFLIAIRAFEAGLGR